MMVLWGMCSAWSKLRRKTKRPVYLSFKPTWTPLRRLRPTCPGFESTKSLNRYVLYKKVQFIYFFIFILSSFLLFKFVYFLFQSVPKKKGRLVGLGRRARSVPPSAPQPYVDPEVLMDQLKDKDDRIAALEQKMADQEAGWEATRKQNEQMMEMMKRMYPNEQFP